MWEYWTLWDFSRKYSAQVMIKCLFYFFREEVDRLAKECRMRLYRVSVKEDINVGGLFQHLAENYVNKLRSSPPPHSMSTSSDASEGSDCVDGIHPHSHGIGGSGPMSLQIQIGGSVNNQYFRTPPALRTSIGSTGSGSSGYSSISHFSSNHVSPQDYLANPMFESLNDNRRHR